MRLDFTRPAVHHQHGLEDAVAAHQAEIIDPDPRLIGIGERAVQHREYAHGSDITAAAAPARPTIGNVKDVGTTAGQRAALRSTLHAKGLRMTPQRQLVLDAVRELRHATPEQVCQRVQRIAPTVNITTVYRALDLLEELGLVNHTHLGHGAPTYSARDHKHVHLV